MLDPPVCKFLSVLSSAQVYMFVTSIVAGAIGLDESEEGKGDLIIFDGLHGEEYCNPSSSSRS